MNLQDQTDGERQVMAESSLRIFLMLRFADGVWKSMICRELSDAVQAWKSRAKPERSAGILHIGFDQPLFQAFDDIAAQHSGRMLMTAAARYAMPASFIASPQPIAYIGNLAVYLGLQGWGYSLQNTIDITAVAKKPQGWVASYIKENPRMSETLRLHKIYNDDSYLNAEHQLDQSARQQLGIFRVRHLVGEKCKDPCKFARVAPPWLAKQKLNNFKMETRAIHIFTKNNIRTVADLATWTSEKLLNETLFGYKTLYSVWLCLNNILIENLPSDMQQNQNHYRDNEATATGSKQNDFKRLGKIMHYGTYCDDPCELARAALPWLANRKLARLNISSSVLDAFKKEGIETVANLAARKAKELHKKFSLEHSAMQHLINCLNAALADSIAANTEHTLNPNLILHAKIDQKLNFSLLDNIKAFLSQLNKSERYVFKKRLRFRATTTSLRKLLDGCEAPIENEQQLESKVIDELKHSAFWCVLIQKLTRLLRTNDFLLCVDDMENLDTWFKGIPRYKRFFMHLVHLIGNEDINIIQVGNDFYLGAINQSAWNNIIEQAKKSSNWGINNNWSAARVRMSIHKLLPDDDVKLKQLLWHQIAQLCHFNINSNKRRVVAGYKKGLCSVVRKILNDSDTPLHYRKIYELACLSDSGEELDELRIYRAAHNAAFLFNQGTYGLAKHIPISDSRMNHIRSLSENIVLAAETKKQWHSSEILSQLPTQLTQSLKALDQYLLSIVLAESKILMNLGWMIWAAVKQGDGNKKRIRRTQTIQNIIKIITQAGHPLSAYEIKKQLAIAQATNKSFSVPPVDPLVRVKYGVWGINDRDVPITREQQQVLVEKLVDKLNKRQFGIHVNEIAKLLALNGCPPYALYSIASQDKRLKTTLTNHIYLAAWKNARIE